ncbi:hypothetical protein RYH80_10460 [Halobaculum sp. MBLA0147]|uniref:hypothetical protein n=1 Tax=Halobaculum sp. MBLA0147 TaxID=3079934 RepID=UPI0035237617
MYDEEIGDFGERLILSTRVRQLLEEYDIGNTHELERIEDEDVLRPELGLEEVIDRFLDDPTVRNEARVVCRLLEHVWELPLEEETQREDTLMELLDMLTHERETGWAIQRVVERDEPRPADQDPVSSLYEILESTEEETET